MLYCPRCNNAHWDKARARNMRDGFAILGLKRPYQCTKCNRVRLGWIFLDLKWESSPKPQRKKHRHKSKTAELKCPVCNSSANRSHRRGLERLLFFIKAYRCSKCEHRFRTFT